VEVVTQPGDGSAERKVTEAEVTFVNLDENRKPIPVERVIAK